MTIFSLMIKVMVILDRLVCDLPTNYRKEFNAFKRKRKQFFLLFFCVLQINVTSIKYVIYRDQQQTIDKKLMVLKENANKCFLLAPLARNHLNICQSSSLMIKATIIRSVITKKKGYVELTNM